MKANKGGALVVVVVILVILIGLGYCASISDQSGGSGVSSSQATRKTSNISEYRITDNGWFGCTEREQMSKLTRYVSQKDEEAFNRELATGLLTGACTQFDEGEIVYLMDATVFAGVVNVRRKGETQTYWTNREAIRQ